MIPEFRRITRQREHMSMPQRRQPHQLTLQPNQILIPTGQVDQAGRAKFFPQQRGCRRVGHS